MRLLAYAAREEISGISAEWYCNPKTNMNVPSVLMEASALSSEMIDLFPKDFRDSQRGRVWRVPMGMRNVENVFLFQRPL